MFGGPIQKLGEKAVQRLGGSDGCVFRLPHQLMEAIQGDLLVITEAVLLTVKLNEPAPPLSEPRFERRAMAKPSNGKEKPSSEPQGLP
ncbi:MAG: hypothetical protein ACOC7K_02585 [bacterium]